MSEALAGALKVDVLGIKVDDITEAEAIDIVEKLLKTPGKHYIVTPNPEFIVAARGDNVFTKILNDADLSIPDGIGLKLTGRVKNRIAGIDLMEAMISLAAQKGYSIGLLGSRGDTAQKTAEVLKLKYPNLKISLAENGGEAFTLTTLNIQPTDMLFVAFGHGKQEKWIADNLPQVPVKLAMGVGGAFDVISGKVPRAPEWMRAIGLEWLFRLVIQPWRIKRQFALIKFLWFLALG
ncbi:MAG: WecB/TagA/CpsF family glycosyltransferase [Candidatus Daviesbacteria bacterium]|nr:WecB/TagA/CpsF family glycosyltransferase [Candidatus Daviesbacteria bacterium]